MSSKDGVYRLSFLFIIFLLFASTAESVEQWNLGLPNSFSAANVTTILNLTYLSQNSVPFIGSGGQVTQDAANLSYYTANGTMVLYALKILGGNVSFNTNTLFVDATNNRVGIGTTNPISSLMIYNSNVPQIVIDNSAGSNASFIRHSSGGASRWAAGMGLTAPGDYYEIYSYTLVGAVMTLKNNGNLGIGTTSFPSGGGTPVLVMAQVASAPTGMGANTSAFYVANLAGTARPYAIDAAGTSTKLTTGNDTLLAQSSLSMPYFVNFFNPYVGKDVEYDVGQAVSDLQNMTGKKYIYLRDIPKEQWALNENIRESEENNKSKNVVVEAWLRNASEMEVTPQGAFEFVWDNKTVTTGKEIGNRIEYLYDENGTVTSVSVPVFETKEISKQKRQLKSGVYFNKNVGKFYRKPTKAEAEAVVGEAYPHYIRQQPPKWMADRGAN